MKLKRDGRLSQGLMRSLDEMGQVRCKRLKLERGSPREEKAHPTPQRDARRLLLNRRNKALLSTLYGRNKAGRARELAVCCNGGVHMVSSLITSLRSALQGWETSSPTKSVDQKKHISRRGTGRRSPRGVPHGRSTVEKPEPRGCLGRTPGGRGREGGGLALTLALIP